MNCPGLHCPGCSGGQSLGIIGAVVLGLAVAAETVQWVAERVWWIGGTVAVCFALAVAAGMWLERWADRRGARFAAAHGIVSRADVIRLEAEPVIRHGVAGSAPGACTLVRDSVPAIAPPQVVNINFYGADATRAAALIRTAIPGTAGDAATGRK